MKRCALNDMVDGHLKGSKGWRVTYKMEIVAEPEVTKSAEQS